MTAFTPTQGRYLAFINSYINLNGYSPAESEIAKALCVMPPSVNQMIRSLEHRGLIARTPGQARSIKILLPDVEIPIWKRGVVTANPKAKGTGPTPVSVEPKVDLYILEGYLHCGPINNKICNKRIARTIECRADNTLEDVHRAFFMAFDRQEDRPYEFNIGGRKRFDVANKNHGLPEFLKQRNKAFKQNLKSYDSDAREVKLADLGLVLRQPFGYSFDFDVDWYHFVCLEKIETAIPSVVYPRLRRRVGPSPPQFDPNRRT